MRIPRVMLFNSKLPSVICGKICYTFGYGDVQEVSENGGIYKFCVSIRYVYG